MCRLNLLTKSEFLKYYKSSHKWETSIMFCILIITVHVYFSESPKSSRSLWLVRLAKKNLLLISGGFCQEKKDSFLLLLTFISTTLRSNTTFLSIIHKKERKFIFYWAAKILKKIFTSGLKLDFINWLIRRKKRSEFN